MAAPTRRPTLAELEEEYAESRRRMKHYARQTTALELQLERIDREQQRIYRRIEQLAGLIFAVRDLDPPASPQQRRARHPMREAATA